MTKVVKGKAVVRMQRNYTEVRSEGEKLHLNSHPLQISQSKKSRNRILMQSLSGGTPICLQVSQFYRCQCHHTKLWRRGLGIRNKTYLDWFVPCDGSPYTSLTGIFVFLVYVKHICFSGPWPCYFLSREFLSLESSGITPSTTSSNTGSPRPGWARIEDLTGVPSTWDKPLCLRR